MVKKKVLLIRLDKIGDLACTLPVDRVLSEEKFEVVWAVQKGLGQIVELGNKSRRYIELDKNNPKQSAVTLSEFLKKEKFDAAVSFQCPWWVNLELLKAKVKIRGGVKSQWHSFLFLNKALRQKRSKAVKHELEYNLDVLNFTFGLKPVEGVNDRSSKNYLYFEMKKPTSHETLNKSSLEEKKYVVVHPGMMGSALNWPQQKYIDYIEKLAAAGTKVVVTGTDADEPYLTEIKPKYANHPQVVWLQSKLKISELIQILDGAEHVLAPSTGVAHLAAGLGTRTVAIFSPIRVHHPTRWAPRGPFVEIVMIELQTS